MTARLLIEWLIPATLWLSFGSLVTWTILALTRCRQWQIHRLAWAAVILQGVVCGWVAWKVPVVRNHSPVAALEPDFDAVGTLATRAGEREAGGIGGGSTNLVAGSLPPQSPTTRSNVAQGLAAFWLAGWLACGAGAAWRLGRWQRRARLGRPAPAHWQREWDAVLQARGWNRSIPLWSHPTEGPLLAWFPGGMRMIVPTSFWATRSVQQRRAVLEHEAGHVVRRDLLVSFVLRVLASIHWFNPLARLAVRRFDEAAEWACDATLARRDPTLSTVLARTLLELAAIPSGRVGVFAVRGARLSGRLRRLLLPPDNRESKMKRILVIVVALLLVTATAVRVHLIAQPPDEASDDRRAEVVWRQRVGQLANRLSADDPLTAKLKSGLASPAALIAIRDRVAGMTEQRRQAMRRQALPEFFTRYFEEENGKLAWRNEHQAYRQKFLAAAQVFDQDLERMHASLSELAEQLGDASEADRLARRLLTHKEAPVVLYIHEIQRRLRPSADRLAEQLGELFVATPEYRYIIRPSRREEAREFVTRALAFAKLEPALRDELAEYHKEFCEKTPFDRRLKEALGDPQFPAFVTMWLLRDFDGDVRDAIPEFFERFNGLVSDTGEGLSVEQPDARRELTEVLTQFDRVRKGSASLKRALADFAGKIESEGELEQSWKRFLATPTAVCFLAAEGEAEAADAGAAARALLMSMLREGDDGKLHLQPPGDESEEELLEHLRTVFREYRMLRLQARPIEAFAERMADEATAKALESLGGKTLVLQEIDRSLRQSSVDVWEEWLEERFHRGDNGWRVKPEAREGIQELLKDIEAIEAESEKDDF